MFFPRLPIEIRLSIWEFSFPGPRILKIIERPLKMTFTDWWKGEAPDEYANWQNWMTRIKAPGDEDTELGKSMVSVSKWVENYNVIFGRTSNSVIPAMLLACKESHMSASKFYKRAFFASSGAIKGPGTFVDFERDTIYIDLETLTWKGITEPIAETDTEGGSPKASIEKRLEEVITFGDYDKVKHLAIPLFFDDKFVGHPSYRLNVHTRVLCQSVFFPQAEDLTLVVNDDIEYSRNDNDLAFIDTIDVQGSISAYNRFGSKLADLKNWGPVALHGDWERFSVSKLEALRRQPRFLKTLPKLSLKMPKRIECRIVVTQKVKEELEEWELRAKEVEQSLGYMEDEALSATCRKLPANQDLESQTSGADLDV